MQSLILQTPKQPDSLKLQELPHPEPGAGQVCVKMTSMGLNRGDLLYCQGRYFYPPSTNSRVGFEGAGIVEKVADSNGTFKPGDRVGILPMSFDVSQQGCFSEYAIYDNSSLLPTPPNLSDEDAGSFWMAYLTAWGGMVERGKLSSNETVVITAASSSVGLAAIQIAKMQGAQVVATTSHENKAQIMLDQGADKVIMMPSNLEGDSLREACEDYVEQLKALTNGKGSDLVFDAVAGPSSYALVKGSALRGRVVIQGMLDRRPMDIHAGVLMKRRLSLYGYMLDDTLDNETERHRAVESIVKGFTNKQLKPVIAKRHALSCFADAFKQLKQNRHIGKILLVPD